MKKYQFLIAILVTISFVQCGSFSSISTSISTSISSISGVISSPSASGYVGDFQARNVQFQKDVQAIISIESMNPSSQEKLNRVLAKAAQKNGILNWERHIDTYYGIGLGLKSSQASLNDLKTILNSIQNQTLKNELEKGYSSI